MRTLMAYTMSRSVSAAIFGAWVAVGVPAPAFANVITDWDEKALVVVTPMASLGGTSPYMAQRMMGMVHAAMFDAVNSIERRYRPYLVQLPADPGEAVAAKVLQARANDGSDAPDAYRPRTTPGVYVPTAITLSSMWPNMKPFTIANPSKFRPNPPIPLGSQELATDFTELKDYGGQISAKRTPSRPRLSGSGLSVHQSLIIPSYASS